MFALRFLLLSLFIWGGSTVPALGGGGYSLALQSFGLSTTVASTANLLDCTQTYWPTTEFTLSYWMRCQQASSESLGIGCGSQLFIQSHNANGYGQYLAPILSTGNTTLSAIGFGTTTVTYNYNLPSPGLFAWNHMLFQYQASSGNFSAYMNGVLMTNKVMSSKKPVYNWCPADGTEWSLNIGRNLYKSTGSVIEEASGRGGQGFWDELSLWNRTLSQAEIQHLSKNKLVGDEQGLLMYYDFNTPDPDRVKNMAFTGSRYDLLLGRTRGAVLYYDNQLKIPTFFTKPVFAPSSVPIAASSSAPPLLVFAVANTTTPVPRVFAVDRPDSNTELRLTLAPVYGDLYNTLDGVTQDGAKLNPGDLITHSSGAVVFNYSAPFVNDTFTFTVNSTQAVAMIHCTNAPQIDPNLVYTVAASGFLGMTPMGKDPLGLWWRRRITVFPARGALWNVERLTNQLTTLINETNPYVDHPGGYFGYVAPTDPLIVNYSIVFENEIGLASLPQSATIVVTATNYLAITTDDAYDLDQNAQIVVNISYIDGNDDIAAIAITKLPQHGTLYHVFPNGTRGAPIKDGFNPYNSGYPEDSYATRVTGLSSYYDDNEAYHPNQTLGKRDVLSYGDNAKANSFRTINGVTTGVIKAGTPPLNYTYDPNTWFTNYGYTEFLEWEFGSKPMYALAFLIGMCRGPGSVVTVKAWSPRQRWETLWSGKADTSVLAARQYWEFSPTICRTPYMTNRLRVEYDTRTIADWAETDYVRFTGTVERASAVLYYDEMIDGTGEDKVFQVMYVPDKRYSGNDSFAYQAYDCPFDRFHGSKNGDSFVRFTINTIPLPPEIDPQSIDASLGANQAISFSARAANNETVSKYTIVSLPKYGHLEVGGVRVTSVPWDVAMLVSPGGGAPKPLDVKYVSDMYSWNLQSSDSFLYSATGASLTSAPALFTIPLKKAGSENPVLAWMALFAIVVICVLSFVMLISRRHHYPLRTLSLTLNLLITTATSLTINIPLHIILFAEGYSCSFYYWTYMLFPSFFCVALVIALYRQRHMFRLERVKKKLSRDGNHEDDLEHLRYLRAATSEQRMAILAALGVLVFIVIAAALTTVADTTVGYYYCHSPPVILYSLLCYWLVGCGLIGTGLYYIRRDFEFTGFRRNVFYLLAYGLSLGVLYILLIAVVQANQQFHSFALLLCMIPLIYQFMAILRPCFLTFSFLRKTASEEEGLEPLSEIIITQKGFAWFLEFCMVEFSQESPLCWRAIQSFKVKTSYAAMKDIYSKYFAPNAPLAVNLSSRSMKDMQMTCPSKNEETPLQELQSIFNLVQVELLHLMQEDSYLRFVASSYYRRFKKGERVPRREHTHTPSTDSGATGTPHGPGSSGSKGSKGSKTVPKEQRSVESQGKEDSKGTAIDPLTGGWAYESGGEEDSSRHGRRSVGVARTSGLLPEDSPTDSSSRPTGSAGLSNSRHIGVVGMVDLETVREGVDEASPSAGEIRGDPEVAHEEGIELQTTPPRRSLTAEEQGLRETLIFNSNPLSKRQTE